jgi:hypothetical protein
MATGKKKTKARTTKPAASKKARSKSRSSKATTARTARSNAAPKFDRSDEVSLASILLASAKRRPTGVLSLTYHLVHDPVINSRWADEQKYADLLDDFGITGGDRRELIRLNKLINQDREGNDRVRLVTDWLNLVKAQLVDSYQNLW